MNMKFVFSLIVGIGLISPKSFSQYSGRTGTPSSSAQGIDSTTGTTADTVPSTTLKKEPTIQTLGEMGEKNTNMGTWLGIAAVGVTSAGVWSYCPACYSDGKSCGKCYAFAAGLAASIMMTQNMMSANQGTKPTAKAVTVGSENYNLNPDGTPNNSPSKPVPPDFEGDPDWKAGKKALKALQDKGFKIDLKKGTITTPDGKTLNASTSAAGMQAQGISSDALKAFDDAMKTVPAKAQEKAGKGTDNQEMFAEGDVGGGGSKATNSNSGFGGFPGLPADAAGSKLGIDRNPSQVAGMKKLFNGEPIGVSADSVFLMIDRRYDLHREKGSFLLPKQ